MDSNIPPLPIELVTDHIIQELRHEAKTLKNCALVSHSWLPASQRILFSKLSIHEHNCTEIIDHVSSSTPNLGRYVERISVFLWGDLRVKINRTAADLTPLLHLLLPHMSHFPRVTELALDGCRAFHDLHWDVAWTDLLATALPSLTRLTIHYLAFKNLADVVDLVSAFPQLVHLTADDLDVKEASHEYSNEAQDPYDGDKTPPVTLSTIKYGSGDFASGLGPFLDWLAAEPQAFSTLHLRLDAEAGDVNSGVALVKAAGSHLKQLTFNFDDQWHMWEGFELSANMSLISLGIRRVSDVGDDLVNILESVNSPLKKLSLGSIHELDEELWPRLVEVLMSSTLASLREVNFFAETKAAANTLRDVISANYPAFFAKGIAIFATSQRYCKWDENFFN
ncbi:F-box domain-containing protein [Favolaschia claudopus]|uniref:F-box domain-containing protein n=1 Tax=Favolaschia claudopus TaxID=2862362 RepID=A0AAW0CFS9_9AGAR